MGLGLLGGFWDALAWLGRLEGALSGAPEEDSMADDERTGSERVEGGARDIRGGRPWWEDERWMRESMEGEREREDGVK